MEDLMFSRSPNEGIRLAKVVAWSVLPSRRSFVPDSGFTTSHHLPEQGM